MKKAERVQLLTSVRIRDFNVYHRHVKIHYFNSSCFQKDSNQNFIMLCCCYLPLASYPVISCEGPLTRLRHSLKLLLCIDWVVEYSSQFIILSWTNLDKERSSFCRPFPFFSPNKMKRMEKKEKGMKIEAYCKRLYISNHHLSTLFGQIQPINCVERVY